MAQFKVGDKVILNNDIEKSRTEVGLPNDVDFSKCKNIQLVLVEKVTPIFIEGKGFISLWRCDGGVIKKSWSDLPSNMTTELQLFEILIPSTGFRVLEEFSR